MLAGDLAHVYADRLLDGVPAAVLRVWNELRLELNLGQYLDIVGTARGERSRTGAMRIARYKTAIDYQAKTLTLTPNGFKPADTMQNMMKTMTEASSGGKPKPKILVPAGQVNGSPAWAQYKPDPAGGHQPWALQVNEVSGGRISRMTFFLETERIFPAFGLPPHLG